LIFLATVAIPRLVRAADPVAEFSVLCFPSHQLADDPIVYPGQPGAAHMHQFIGNPSTNAYSTFESMSDPLLRPNVKCELHNDTGGYWVPTLHKPDGTPVPVSHSLFYYRGPAGVAQIPQGLKMLAGGNTLQPPNPTGAQKSLSWACTDSSPFYTQPPDCTSLNTFFRAHIHFPSCVAVDPNTQQPLLDSFDHRSHMAYPTSGRCPSTHPLRIPKISYHVVYALKNGKGTYLSSDHGAPGGTTLHADFWNTWDQAVLQKAVTKCINANISCKRLKDGDTRLQ
jgi:hypothetical protein